MNDNTTDVIIIGAGLTGLTLAFYLKKNGVKFLLLEQKDRTGGVINSISEQGFTYETGPNTGVLSAPEIVELFEDLKSKCLLETANPLSKNRYIWKKGSWHALPSGLISAIQTPLFSFYDKLRILGEPLRKAGKNKDETVAELVTRRLGKSYLDYAVDPFISGIYAGDPGKLVTKFALPKLYNLEQNYGSFIRGAIKKHKEPKSLLQQKTTGEVFSVQGGLKSLIVALNQGIGADHIVTGCKDTELMPNGNKFLVTFTNQQGEKVELNSSKVITTVGGYALPELLPFISPKKIIPISRLVYAGVVQAVAGYKNWSGSSLDAFGGLVPSKEKRAVLGILFPSSIFANRTPANGALLSVFIGGVKNPGIMEQTDTEIETLVLKEIRETLDVDAPSDLFRIFRYPFAIPQYDKSSEERLASINQIQVDYPGLLLAGNIRDGIGMSDRVKQARQLADLIINA